MRLTEGRRMQAHYRHIGSLTFKGITLMGTIFPVAIKILYSRGTKKWCTGMTKIKYREFQGSI